jgi:hypothetical protein
LNLQEINALIQNNKAGWIEYAKKAFVIVAVLAIAHSAYVLFGGAANSNNDDPRIQRIYDSITRSEGLLGSLDDRLKRVEQTATAGEAGSQAVITGIGTVIGLMEDSEGRQLNSARNREAAAERAQFVEDILRKVYQREQAKEK